ncbi:MAG: cytochrome P450 [Myxococcota bacterium]
MSDPQAQLPPGHDGLPVLGETLRFLGNIFGFVGDGARRHGPVFRSRILGRRTAVLSGPEATDAFVDPERVQRSGAMPPNIQTLFGGESLPVLDGAKHRERKSFVMAAFTRDALAGYVPILQRSIRAALADATTTPKVSCLDAFQHLAIEAICEMFIGLKPSAELEEVREDYVLVVRAVASLPLPLPWSKFARGKRAVQRILAVYAKAIKEHEQGAARTDGLARILSAKVEDKHIDHAALQRELHHIVIAGYIVWGWFCTTVIELGENQELCARLTDEVAKLPADYHLDAVDALPLLRTVSMEVRRVSPVVPVSFGVAHRDFMLGGYRVPAGWMVLWSPSASNRAPVFSEPDRFDPTRFGESRHEDERHRHAYVPNGGGDAHTGHKCAGHELASLMLRVFTIELLRGYRFELLEGRPSYDSTKIPAEPSDGLPVRFTAK